MTGPHPDDATLLAYSEGDADAASTAHVEACARCRAEVEAAREAGALLKAAPHLELPAGRRESLVPDLPAYDQPRGRYISPMRLVTVLAPVAAVLAIAVTVANVDFGGRDEAGGDAGGRAVAEDAGGGGGELEGAGSDSAAPLARVQGPPERIAGFLRSRGYDAFVEGQIVVVRYRGNARESRKELERLLETQPAGQVPVVPSDAG